ncbi:basic proline-rich protein-like [Phyllostomus discolor]|uniref:Basic proline-rich protein-like n=1 Tax=Phyllostomus discolor TaxID=89673 RepID=A0A6J2NH36_9CHIR|nr:basic proline-rich protein-like [Phyllostomus discolor]
MDEDPGTRPHFGPRRLRLGDKGAAALHPRPSGAPATQDEYPAAATARAAGHKAGLRSPPRPGAGLARPHPLTALGWRCGGERGAVRAAPGAELSDLRAPPHARPRRGRPPRAPGRCSRAPHKVTVCGDGGARTPASPELPALPRREPPPRPWPPATAGRRGARSDGGDPSRPARRGREKGQWRLRALIRDICPRVLPLCGSETAPPTPHPRAPPLAAGPDVMGAAISGRAAAGRVPRLVTRPRGGGGGCSRAEGRNATNGAEFLEPGHGSPCSAAHAARRVAAALGLGPWGERRAEGASPAGAGSARVTEGQGDTAARGARGACHCASAASAPAPAPPAPAGPWPSPRCGRARGTSLRSTRLPSRKIPSPGLVGPRPVAPSPPTPDNAAGRGLPIPELRGEPPNAGAAASPGPFPGDPGRARPSAAISAAPPPAPSRCSSALKAGGWAGPQAEAAAGAGGRARELSERRAPPPEPPSLPPSPSARPPCAPLPPRTPAPRPPPPPPPPLARAAEQ